MRFLLGGLALAAFGLYQNNLILGVGGLAVAGASTLMEKRGEIVIARAPPAQVIAPPKRLHRLAQGPMPEEHAWPLPGETGFPLPGMLRQHLEQPKQFLNKGDKLPEVYEPIGKLEAFQAAEVEKKTIGEEPKDKKAVRFSMRDAVPFPDYGFSSPVEKLFIGYPANLVGRMAAKLTEKE
ncbi:hypothetical protein HYS54_03540 [Candidatus Micrarchaeota archaeon]|nr:hypothetical protein [Candidatus Micrarchaeota archaeon]